MAEKVDKHILSNGMAVLGEPIENIASSAMTLLIPAGASRLPNGCGGASSVICDWIMRGAGDMDSRQLIDTLDGLGLHKSSTVSSSHINLSASMEASNLLEAMKLYADIVLRPRLEPAQFELSRQLGLHELLAMDDDPRHKVMTMLYERFYPRPLGNSPYGTKEELESLNPDRAADIVKSLFDIPGSILAVAGKYDFEDVCRTAEELFGDSEPVSPVETEVSEAIRGNNHHQYEGAQVHIGMMTEADEITSDSYYDIMTAVSILSGGMSSRLFTEVREKRGLCYAVAARYHCLKGYAGIFSYAGTTPDKAQQTLDVIKGEFDRLGENITDDEMARAKVGLKSSVVMQSESSSARAMGIASDHYLLGRVRSLDEIKENVEKTTKKSVADYLEKRKFSDYTVMTIGPVVVKA